MSTQGEAIGVLYTRVHFFEMNKDNTSETHAQGGVVCACACMTSCVRLTLRLCVSEVESNNSPVCVFFDLCTQHLHLLPCVRFGKLTYSFRRRAQIEHVNTAKQIRERFLAPASACALCTLLVGVVGMPPRKSGTSESKAFECKL